MNAEPTPQPPPVSISLGGDDRPPFIPKAKAAAVLSVSSGTIDRLRDDGEIEAINVRGAVKVLVSSLEAYIDASSTKPKLDGSPARRPGPNRAVAGCGRSARRFRSRRLMRQERRGRQAVTQLGPTKGELDELRRTLKPGEQRRISEGVYVRREGAGRLRFQTRLRLAGANSHSPARTFDTWEQADRDYHRRRHEKENLHSFTWRERERKWPIERYAVERYWPDKQHHAELTLLEYRTLLERDVLAYFRGWTLEQIVTAGDLAAAGYAPPSPR